MSRAKRAGAESAPAPSSLSNSERGMCSGGRRRQLRHQAKRGGELLELEVRAKMRNRLVHPGLARHVAHHDSRLAQRIARLHPVARSVVGGDVLADPPVEKRFGVLARREPADPVRA